ncbi:MAG: epoxyqueuosine reductase QueH [Ruminiclostridium sp.]|nr:epoxyqueuosine reductase QueH [Ruminiclostridium sp.]
MKLLLHICCAPCATGVVKKLSADGGIAIHGYYYNPNIQPRQENRARLESVLALSRDENFPVVTEEAMLLDFWKEKLNVEKTLRCNTCYALRIDQMAKTAKEQGLDAFTTSLLISPWQDHEKIKALCETAARQYGISFLYQDFRPFYREGKNEAWKKGYYLQKYCGCIYSWQESDHKKKPTYDFA